MGSGGGGGSRERWGGDVRDTSLRKLYAREDKADDFHYGGWRGMGSAGVLSGNGWSISDECWRKREGKEGLIMCSLD